MANPEPTLEEAGLSFLSGDTFRNPDYFHACASRLRREDPVHWVEHDNFNPFWVLTKHADILDSIRTEKAISDAVGAKLKAAVDAFAKSFA